MDPRCSGRSDGFTFWMIDCAYLNTRLTLLLALGATMCRGDATSSIMEIGSPPHILADVEQTPSTGATRGQGMPWITRLSSSTSPWTAFRCVRTRTGIVPSSASRLCVHRLRLTDCSPGRVSDAVSPYSAAKCHTSSRQTPQNSPRDGWRR